MTRPRWSSLHLSLVHLAVAGGLCVAAVCELLDAGPLREVHAIYVFPGLATLFALSGLVAWWRRPGNRLGALLVATGGAWLVSGLQNSGVPAAIAVGLVTASLPLAMLVHLLHAAPGGRLRDRTARVVVGAGYATALLLQVPLWAFAPSGPPFDVLLVSPRPELASTGQHVQNTAGGLVTLVTVALLVARLRGYSRQQRPCSDRCSPSASWRCSPCPSAETCCARASAQCGPSRSSRSPSRWCRSASSPSSCAAASPGSASSPGSCRR